MKMRLTYNESLYMATNQHLAIIHCQIRARLFHLRNSKLLKGKEKILLGCQSSQTWTIHLASKIVCKFHTVQVSSIHYWRQRQGFQIINRKIKFSQNFLSNFFSIAIYSNNFKIKILIEKKINERFNHYINKLNEQCRTLIPFLKTSNV